MKDTVNEVTMSIEVLYNLPEFFAGLWNWCSHRDPRVAFGLGVLFWMATGRLFSLFGNPVQKVVALIGFLVILLMALAFWVGFSGALAPGEVPFGKATRNPNANTLMELQK